MDDSQSSASVVRFGTFEVNLHSRELRKHGMRIRMEEKPFQILELLLERAGHVVTRRALREKLWPDTIVSYEHGLNTAVNKLRDLLSDSARSPRFIETFPRLGYRFIAPVTGPGQSAAAARRMLLVLPFENLCGDDEQELFADGLTEEMTPQLGRLNPNRLGVIARTSATQYKATRKSIGEIAEEMHVDCVLEGSVRCNGTRVRITGQLIEARNQTHLLSAIYDRELSDALDVHADVACQICKALVPEVITDDVAAGS